MDLTTIHQTILPLGAVITAAVGRFPGLTPEQMFDEIRRHSRFTPDEFATLAMSDPLDMHALHLQIRAMLDEAEIFIKSVPSEAIGVVFLDGDRPVRPDPSALAKYQQHHGARRGHWPSSSEIGSAMIERYVERKD